MLNSEHLQGKQSAEVTDYQAHCEAEEVILANTEWQSSRKGDTLQEQLTIEEQDLWRACCETRRL